MALSELAGKTVPIKLWTALDDVEFEALTQLKNIASLPWVFKHIACMPDVHFGKGATVGSVVAMKDAVAPAAVGVDIGCGMAAVKTSLDANKVDRRLAKVRSAIEESIPVGFNAHDHGAVDGLGRLELKNRARA